MFRFDARRKKKKTNPASGIKWGRGAIRRGSGMINLQQDYLPPALVPQDQKVGSRVLPESNRYSGSSRPHFECYYRWTPSPRGAAGDSPQRPGAAGTWFTRLGQEKGKRVRKMEKNKNQWKPSGLKLKQSRRKRQEAVGRGEGASCWGEWWNVRNKWEKREGGWERIQTPPF